MAEWPELLAWRLRFTTMTFDKVDSARTKALRKIQQVRTSQRKSTTRTSRSDCLRNLESLLVYDFGDESKDEGLLT